MGIGTSRRDSGIAWTCLLALHLLTGWLLVRAMRVPASTPDDAGLQVVFLPLRVAASAAPKPKPKPQDRRDAIPRERPAITRSVHPVVDARPATAPVPSASLRARLLEQSASAAANAARIGFASPDALADRQVRLPGRAGGRFRMQGPLTPQQVVAIVGGLFGGIDARAEICARNRENLANLSQGGDSPELQVELETQRRYCSP